MSDEKINNLKSWKEKINDPEFFDENGFPNKNKVWEDLYKQLHGETLRERNINWFKVAAVILFLLVSGAIGFHKISFTSSYNKLTDNKARLLLKNHLNIPLHTNNLNVSTSGGDRLNKMVKRSKNSTSFIKHSIKYNKNKFSILENVVGKQLLVQPDTSSEILTLQLPAKKSLKVIANNEIENTTIENGSITNKYHFFYIRNKATDRTPIMTQSIGRTYIKIKLPPQN